MPGSPCVHGRQVVGLLYKMLFKSQLTITQLTFGFQEVRAFCVTSTGELEGVGFETQMQVYQHLLVSRIEAALMPNLSHFSLKLPSRKI